MLTVWCIRLGIRPERIERGKPQQNGSHERMHRTLKAETTRPAASSRRLQQQRFNEFRECYNDERPHEALDQETPSTHYRPSSCPYPKHLPQVSYGPGVVVRRVSVTGQFAWYRRLVFASTVLAGQQIGIEEETPGKWIVSFGPLILGDFDPQKRILRDAPRWKN
jgi:hypothetical protein